MKVKNFSEAKRYLDSFINYEKKDKFPYQKSLKLKRVEILLERLYIPYQKLKVIHIAGTKGKGSTAAFCSNILSACGYRVGLYTSPHLFDLRERIQVVSSQNSEVRSQKISKKDVVRILRGIRPCLEKLRFNKDLGNLTFFEVYTAIAFKYFLEKRLDFVVLETGLGGRLDATNVTKPLVAIITHIGYDHTDKLGSTLAEISAEKAGIIKNRIPTVSSLQRKSVYGAIRARCKKMKSQLFSLGRDFRAEKTALCKNYTLFNFKSKKLRLNNLKIYLKGKCQVENASLAIMAISTLKERGLIDKEINFKDGLMSTSFEGRFETILKKPLVIVDVAHNPSAFSVLGENLKEYFSSKKIILIFSASRDKDVKTMLKKLVFSRIIITTFKNPRAFSPYEIKNICKIKGAAITENIKEAFTLAKKLYTSDSLILISGSLFLVSEAKKLLQATGHRF
ncbi:MAG: folylpolyglutamate synthase/dihydrofolate synthase family protein [Candidatus Omnitrophota bacterium]|nr:folylpolyglutamate synthase/dihydrofolate synthase family protein [Candidatus Omnitrophota bacterium]